MEDKENTALVPSPVSGELAALGTRMEVRELVRRIQTQAPGGMQLTPTECVTLAQYSFSLGANPLVGEAWLLKNQQTGKVLGLMPGIRLYRRRADEKDERTGDSRWTEAEIVTDPDDRFRLGIPADAAMAVRVRLYRQSQTKAHSQACELLGKAGAPWSDIKAAYGLKPYIEGVGFVTKSEADALDRAGDRNKMPLFQRVEKRAEAHALKQAYSLPFGFSSLSADSDVPSGATLDDYIFEGEFKDVTPVEDTRTPGEIKEAAAKGATALYGEPVSERRSPDLPEPIQDVLDRIIPPAQPQPAEDPAPRAWPVAVVDRLEKVLVEGMVIPPGTARKHLIMLLNLSPFGIAVKDEDILAWGKVYRGKRDEGMTSKDAARAAREPG